MRSLEMASRAGASSRQFKFGGVGFLLGRLFVAFAAVVGDVKPAAFENQAATRADLALYRAASPFPLRTNVLRADIQRLVRDGLELLEFQPALGANIFVSGHTERF